MKRAQTALAAAVLLVAVVAHAESPANELAQAYNVKGMEFYKQRMYDSAEVWFRQALKADPDHRLANYNLACILSLKLSRDRWSCHIEDGDANDPFAQLERAIKLDPGVAQRAARDPDFMNVRLTPRFQMLIGADLTNQKLIQAILVGQGEWFGIPCGGWCGNDLLFSETGEVWKRIYTGNGKGQDILEYEDGQYSIDGGTITMRFSSGEVLHGHFDERGDLRTGTRDVARYTVFPSGDI